LLAVFLLAAFIAITAWNLMVGWFLPPQDWDGLAYHLPIMAAFYQAHAVFPIEVPSVWIRYYPVNGELLELWNLAVVGVDKVIDWAFTPTMVIGMVAIYGLCRKLGVRPLHAMLGACVTAVAPGMLIQQGGSLKDGMFVALIAMGVFMVFEKPSPQSEESNAVLWMGRMGTAICAGLLVGLKYSGSVYAAGLFFLMGIQMIRNRKPAGSGKAERGGIHRWPVMIFCCGVLFLGLAGYPYIRNLATAANPLAPFEIHLGDLVLFEGSKEMGDFVDWTTPEVVKPMAPILRALYVWFEPYQSVYDTSLGGLGPLWIVIGLPSLLVWILHCIRQRRVWELSISSVILAGCAMTPAFWHPRYILMLLILGSMATAAVLGGLNVWIRRIVLFEIVFLLLFSGFNVLAPHGLSASDAMSFLKERNDQTRSSSKFITRENGGRVYEWIDRMTMETPSVIAYGKQVTFVYTLYGSDLRNRVVNILPENEEDWRVQLDQSRTELVLVLDWTANYEWMIGMQDFQEVYRDGSYVIFQRVS